MEESKNKHESFIEELSLHVAKMLLEYESHNDVGIAFSVDLEFPAGRTLYIQLVEDEDGV